jgi:raffinose/stachyose/melibiose transport system permease protein
MVRKRSRPRPSVRHVGRNGGQLIRFGYWWWALPAVIAMAAAHYGATVVGGFFAFTDWKGLGDFNFVGLDNFHRVFADPKMVTALVNTLVLAAGFVIGTNGIGLLLALGLNRGVKSRYLLRTLLFMPVVLSPLAVSYLWRFIFDFHGPLNSLLESIGREDLQRIWLADPTFSLWVVMFVMVWQGAGIALVVYLAGLTAVSVEVEEAAVLDGAGTWSRFRHVVLPAIRPAITISLTLTIIQGLRAFDQIFALTGGGPAGATETMATQVYKQAFTLGNFGFGAAMALVLTLVILAFTIIQQSALRRSEG